MVRIDRALANVADEPRLIYTNVVRRIGVLTFARLVVLLAILAPTWLGPAMTPLVQALGGVAEHHCLCGMKRGECGCPECEALEHARTHDRDDLPGIRTTCDTDSVAPAHTPAAFLPASRLVIACAVDAPEVAPALPSDPVILHRERPPTPPPRQLRA